MDFKKEMIRTKHILLKNSPTILTATGIVGMISSSIMAVNVTPKAYSIIRESEIYLEKEINLKEKTKLVWKFYIPSVITGTLSIGCILLANRINLRRQAALVTLYAVAKETLEEYQNNVIEQIGKNKEEKIQEKITQEKINNNPSSEIIILGKGESLFFDDLTSRYFKSDIEKVRKFQNDFNAELFSEGYKTLNELYDFLGLEGTELGKNLGWKIDNGLLDIKFSSKITPDGLACIVLKYNSIPIFL